MIYPIYNTLQKLDKSYVEAAQDLGANPVQVFFKAVLPLSMPGIVSGILNGIHAHYLHIRHCRVADNE